MSKVKSIIGILLIISILVLIFLPFNFVMAHLAVITFPIVILAIIWAIAKWL